MTERSIPRSIQRFDVLAVLGDGGMGTVYRARDPQLERDVAIKVLHASTQARSALSTEHTIDLRGRGGGKRRDDLLQEARMMARLSHPNVVPIFEVGLDETGNVFVVMEYVAGEDLRQWLKADRAAAAIARVFVQAAHGLAAAHERGIVHRDFKPDNVLIGLDGRARVTDFGISKLGESTGLVHTDKVAGTPKYMAPELWRGEPATPASDVFALCTAFLDATDASEPVAALVQRGLAKQPQDRPSIDELITALEVPGPRTRRVHARHLALGGAAIAVIGTGVGFAMRSSGEHASCVADPRLLAGRWHAGKRAATSASFPSTPRAEVDRLLDIFDRRAHEITALHRDLCEATYANRLTAAQAAQQTACLELRAIELGSVVDAARTDLIKAEIRFNRTSLPSSCNAIAVTTRDPAALAPLYARLVTSAELSAADALVELAAIETAARAAGDPELAVKAAVNLGARQRAVDQSTASDETLRRAYEEAVAIDSSEAATNALAERILTLANSNDLVQTKTLGALATTVAARPSTTPRARLRLLRSIGRATTTRGETRASIELLRKAIAEAEQTPQHDRDIEALLRVDLAEAMLLLGEQIPEAIVIARQAVELTRVQGEATNNHGIALNLLSKAYMVHNDLEQALAYRRRALDVFAAIFPADHSAVLEARVDLGVTLVRASQFEAAQRELAAAVELARENESMRRSYPWMLARLAQATSELGRFEESVRLFEQAIDLLGSTLGTDHPQTLRQRFAYAELALALGRLDEVDRAIALIVQGYQRTAEPRDKRPALLHGSLAADLELARGHPKQAETLARQALAELTELGAEAHELAIAQRRLGEALVAQRRFDEAKPLLEAALATARANKLRADKLADYELPLAEVEAGLGKPADARARAERLRAVLERYPAAGAAREHVARLLANRRR